MDDMDVICNTYCPYVTTNLNGKSHWWLEIHSFLKALQSAVYWKSLVFREAKNSERKNDSDYYFIRGALRSLVLVFFNLAALNSVIEFKSWLRSSGIIEVADISEVCEWSILRLGDKDLFETLRSGRNDSVSTLIGRRGFSKGIHIVKCPRHRRFTRIVNARRLTYSRYQRRRTKMYDWDPIVFLKLWSKRRRNMEVNSTLAGWLLGVHADVSIFLHPTSNVRQFSAAVEHFSTEGSQRNSFGDRHSSSSTDLHPIPF